MRRSTDVISVKFLNQVSSGMCKVGTMTEVKTLVKSRMDKSPTPVKYHKVFKLSFFVGAVGSDYEKLVNNRLMISGESANFEAAASSMSAPFPASENNVMRMGLKDHDKKYVRIYFNVSPNKYNETFYINERGDVLQISDADFEAYFPVKNSSEKQSDHGLDKDLHVIVREFKAENILYFQSGSHVWNNLSDKFLKLFNLENV